MKKFLISNTWWMVLIIALAMLIGHTFGISVVKIDHISVILLFIIFFSPFILAIKKIKIGDFEAEIDPSEVQKLKDQVSKVAESDKSTKTIAPPSSTTTLSLLADSDPVLGLAKLRIELEKSLTGIYRATRKGEPHNQFIPSGRLVQILYNEELLPSEIATTTRETISICNRAMHGEDIRQSDAKSVIESGISILKELSGYLNEYKGEPTESTTISNDIVDQHRNARYRVKTIVPYVNDPVQNTYIFDQESLDEFLEGYDEVGEFLIEIVEINYQAPV